MKIPRIANAVGHIDDDLIAAAAGTQRKTNRNPWIKWGGTCSLLCSTAHCRCCNYPFAF